MIYILKLFRCTNRTNVLLFLIIFLEHNHFSGFSITAPIFCALSSYLDTYYEAFIAVKLLQKVLINSKTVVRLSIGFLYQVQWQTIFFKFSKNQQT